MFSDNYVELDEKISRIVNEVRLSTPKETQEILQKSLRGNLSLEDSARLLEIGNHSDAQEQFDLMREFTYSQFRNQSNTLRHIAPVYLSSHCIDTCGYCNFSARRNDVKRTRLEFPRLEEELCEVLESGNRVIEFTLATDPEFTPEVFARYISKTRELLPKEQGAGVLLCSDYFTEEQYKDLKNAGLWGMVQWDETLDREMYRKWHKLSPRKSDFTTRINNHNRAIQVGLEVATGCLFGLSDFRYDVLMQLAKARHLEREYGIKPFVFGTPRLKPIAGRQLHPKFEVNDRQYETSLMVYKISEPSIARWLQTRESPELNLRNILDGDVYTYRCGEVKPGGYKVNRNTLDTCKGGQFGVSEMTSEQFERELTKRDFKVDYSWIK